MSDIRSDDLIGGVITDATIRGIEVHLKDGRYVVIEPDVNVDEEGYYPPECVLVIMRRV